MEHSVENFWETRFALLHDKPKEVSENGILFTAEWHYLRHMIANKNIDNYPAFDADQMRSMAVTALSNTITGQGFVANPPEAPGHFSHDNATAVYALSLLYNEYESISKLPIVKYNNNYHLHPRDIIWRLIVKLYAADWDILGSILTIFTAPFMIIMMNYSLSRSEEESSGKLMWWIRIESLKMNFDIDLSTDMYNNTDWANVFCIYFKIDKQPNRTLAMDLYEF